MTVYQLEITPFHSPLSSVNLAHFYGTIGVNVRHASVGQLIHMRRINDILQIGVMPFLSKCS
ncbi:MAG: hypothetical protein WA667_03550 [Candidatus Nitrosopolaris sp.]